MIRRTLALAGAAALALAASGLSGPAAADSGPGIATQNGVLINEIAAGLDLFGYSGGFIELFNDSEQSVDVSGWTVIGCTGIDSFEIQIPPNTELAPEDHYLIADDSYSATSGPAPNSTFDNQEVLTQTDGGVLLLDDSQTPAVVDGIMYGTPDSVCSDLTDAEVSPTNDESIHRGEAWQLATVSPERWS